MSPEDIFNAVESEFDKQTAIGVVSLHAIHLTTKIKESDLQTKNQFQQRFEDKAKSKVLWRLDDKQFKSICDINDALHVFELSQTMHGIGGCVKKTLKEIIANKNEKDELFDNEDSPLKYSYPKN